MVLLEIKEDWAWCFMCLDCLFKYFTMRPSRRERDDSPSVLFFEVPRIFYVRGVKHNFSFDR